MDTTSHHEDDSRPLGFWLKAVDRLMAAEFAAAFEPFGITRREWRLLNRIDGTVPGGPGPIRVHKLARLIELGWVTDADDTWALTEEGREAKERLGGIVEGIRAKAHDAVPAEDLATTIATLEQLARAYGWDENTPLPRGRGHHPGHGRGHGFGPHGADRHPFDRHEFGPHGADRHGFADRHCRHGEHPFAAGADRSHRPHGHGHPRAHIARFAQGAYECGFEAGFTRGRDDR